MSIQRLVLAAALSGLLLGLSAQMMPALADPPPPSRLSQLVLNRSTLYLPTRLFLGEENRFILKGKPGSKVMLFISPKSEGFKLPNGLALRVGEDNERLEGTIPEKGVLELTLPVPDEADWAGHALFVDAVMWSQDDYADIIQFQMLDATGRRASDNALMMAKRATASGTSFMPAMPGISAQALQQVTTMSEVLNSGDERKKELIDMGGRNSDSLLDRNSFIQRPGQSQPLK
jgi:hypothetical protein